MSSEPQLDLTYLATGNKQHVFVKTGEAAHDWVYKIPAAYGYVLPFETRLQSYRPDTTPKKVLYSLLVRLPRFIYAAAHERLIRFDERHQTKLFEGGLKFLEGFGQRSVAARDQLLAACCKQLRLKNFESMLEQIEYLSSHSLADVLLPFKIVRDGKATLRVDGSLKSYRGPIFIQRKADLFFKECRALDSFDWNDVINAQHRLWRCGVALSDYYDILGPHNWALLDGRLHLADTSSLTRSFRRARQLLSEESLDQKVASMIRRLRAIPSLGSASECLAAEEYFSFIRREINLEKLERLWKADLKKRGEIDLAVKAFGDGKDLLHSRSDSDPV